MPSAEKHSHRRPGSTHRLKQVSALICLLLATGIIAFVFSPWTGHVRQSLAALQPTRGHASLSKLTRTTQIRFVITTPGGASSTHDHNAQHTHDHSSQQWAVGDCTYWANLRYRELSGYWIPWNGGPNVWVIGARQAGWMISAQAHLHSIIVLMPYVQGANANGMVGVVEGMAAHGTLTTVHTSLMNWQANGSGWNRESEYDFTVGAGVYFIWHP